MSQKSNIRPEERVKIIIKNIEKSCRIDENKSSNATAHEYTS